MASKQSERYVRYYTFGSTAAKLDSPEKRARLPRMKPEEKRKPIPFDPVAFVGSAVALLLAVLMVVGLIQLAGVNVRVQKLQTQVTALEQEQKILIERYESGYDLDEIRAAAESMGMIPADQADRVQVQVPAEVVETPRLSWWDSLLASVRQLFA